MPSESSRNRHDDRSIAGVAHGTICLVLLLAFVACGDSSPSDPGDGPEPDLGIGASLKGWRPFPDDNPWNRDISGEPVDPNSQTLIESCGDTQLHPDFGTVWDGAPNGIPYVVVPGDQPRVPVAFDLFRWSEAESDPGPYPIPANAPIEGGPDGGGDRHVLVFDRDDRTLYELYYAFPVDAGEVVVGG